MNVTRQLRDDHRALRQRLDLLDVLLERVAAGSGQAFVDARTQLDELIALLVRHLEREEAALEAMFAPMRGGQARILRLHGDHAAQRIEAAELCALDTETSTGHWAAQVRHFSERLRAEMDREDAELAASAERATATR